MGFGQMEKILHRGPAQPVRYPTLNQPQGKWGAFCYCVSSGPACPRTGYCSTWDYSVDLAKWGALSLALPENKVGSSNSF